MALVCPAAKCRAVPGMCLHEKVSAIAFFIIAALALVRLTATGGLPL